MNIVLDSLKFYKLKNEHTARILFLIVYVILIGFYLFPIGEPIDAQAMLTAMMDEATPVLPSFSGSNILYFASLLGMLLLTGFFSQIYATCYVMQAEGFPSKKAILASVRGIPKLFAFLVLMAAPVAISSLLAFIPLIYLFYALFLTPLLIMEGKKGIIDSITQSFRATKGIKFSIFVNQIFLYFIMNLPITLVSSLFYSTGNSGTLAEYLVMAFLQASYILMSGRLIGKFYLLAVKNQDKLRNGTIDVIRDSGSSDESDNTSETKDDQE